MGVVILQEDTLSTQQINQPSNDSRPAMQQLPPGYVLASRYQVQDVIGVGGMGSVYRARDLHFQNAVKLVAVKEMINQAPDPLVRRTIVQNFEREANILVTLSHPSIPKIFDFFNVEDKSYLVLEFINGKDLEAILNSSPGFIPENQVIAWAIELCDVLAYLHSHKPEPIIFRDMKPSNVMINQHGHVMLIDYGIAKIFKTGQKGTMIGTEGYSPPEQYRGEATPVADLYSLGATLHHLLSKRDPRLEAPFSFSERPMRQINPAVSPELELVINNLLRYDPEERYKTADAVREALMGVAKKTGALISIQKMGGITGKEQGIKPFWTFQCEDEVRGSATYDSGFVYVGSYDNNLYALNAATGEFSWKFATEGGIITRPAVEDAVLYLGSEDHNFYAVSARSGKQLWTCTTGGPIRCSPRIAEGHAFIGSDDGFLRAVNLSSQRETWRVDANGAVRSMPIVNNGLIYFGSDNGDFFCIDFRGQIKWQYRAKRAIFSSPLLSGGLIFFTSLDGTFCALDAKSGWVIWRFRMGKGSISSPCKADNLVYAGSADGYIYCVEATSAKEVWRFQTNHQVSGSPVVYKDALYCGSADGTMYCLDSKNGRVRWKFSTGGAITAAPVVVNDILYFGSVDHILYALNV